MNIMTKQGSLDNQVTYEHYCDTKADLENIPKNEITLGTVAVVLKDDDDTMGIYIADSNKEWNSFSSGGSSAEKIELEELTITENGVYDAEEGKGFNRVIAEVNSGADPDIEDGLVARTLTSYTNSRITNIGNGAFAGCSSLTTVSFPKCTSIGDTAFAGCSSLTTVSFPECTSIGDYIFATLSSLTTVSFPKCTSIGRNAFGGCSSLTTVSFPKCTSIGNGAFGGCSSLTTVSFPECTSIGANAFASCSSLTTVSFPKCASIGNSAFIGCSSLTTVSFPECTSIGSRAFAACPSLNNVYLNRSSLITISLSVSKIFGTYSTITYYVPASLVDAYKSARYWSAVSSRFSAYDFNN